jgi:hypothetical protein
MPKTELSMRVKAFLLCLTILALGLGGARAMEPIVIIKSPDEGHSFVYGGVSNRKLQWSDKENKLYAVLTVDNSRYAGNGERAESETLRFYLPEVQKDPATKTYYVLGRNNEKINLAETKKELFFDAIKPVRNAVVRVIKTKGRYEVVAEIYRPEDIAAEDAKAKGDPSATNEWQKMDLNSVIGQ